jgi:hypothetical protein
MVRGFYSNELARRSSHQTASWRIQTVKAICIGWDLSVLELAGREKGFPVAHFDSLTATSLDPPRFVKTLKMLMTKPFLTILLGAL